MKKCVSNQIKRYNKNASRQIDDCHCALIMPCYIKPRRSIDDKPRKCVGACDDTCVQHYVEMVQPFLVIFYHSISPEFGLSSRSCRTAGACCIAVSGIPRFLNLCDRTFHTGIIRRTRRSLFTGCRCLCRRCGCRSRFCNGRLRLRCAAWSG